MSYLIIPSSGGTRRRVDLGAIAALFAEDEPATPPPPRFGRALDLARALLAALNDTVGLLREEALARKRQTRRPEPRAMRAFGI